MENYEVGKFYLVPCVLLNNRFFPVLPHKHSDPQFGRKTPAALPHYHYDLRFWTKADFRAFPGSVKELRTDNVFVEGVADWQPKTEIKFRRRKCQREFTGLHRARLTEIQKSWYAAQIGKSCAGRICPHFRQPMIERADGVLECPYHGLLGDPKTEKIIGNIHEVI